jgi:sugar/nucleoside kinase (ribokinase family)
MNNIKLPTGICCAGHITKDKIITPEGEFYMAGGTAFYFSHAIKRFDDISFSLKTIVGYQEKNEIEKLRSDGVNISVSFCESSVYFENIYKEDYEERKQHVLSKAAPFTIESLRNIDAGIVHLGTLLADDFSIEAIQFIAQKAMVSIDSQGFLREVRGTDVFPVNWKQKNTVLKCIHFLKANEHELEVLTETKNIKEGIEKLYEWGVKEVIVTLGGAGSIIFDGTNYNLVPAYKPKKMMDTTGCGDTYMAGYLYKRALGSGIEDAGKFAAAIATLKIEHYGPFSGGKEEILNCIKQYQYSKPVL